MFLLTEPIPTPPFFGYFSQDSQSFWSEPQTGRTFFYCICDVTYLYRTNLSFVFRFDVRAPQWHFVGELDFSSNIYMDVSPCGHYFWSLQANHTPSRNVEQLIFRQINPNTLQYTRFYITPESKKLAYTATSLVSINIRILYRIGLHRSRKPEYTPQHSN